MEQRIIFGVDQAIWQTEMFKTFNTTLQNIQLQVEVKRIGRGGRMGRRRRRNGRGRMVELNNDIKIL